MLEVQFCLCSNGLFTCLKLYLIHLFWNCPNHFVGELKLRQLEVSCSTWTAGTCYCMLTGSERHVVFNSVKLGSNTVTLVRSLGTGWRLIRLLALLEILKMFVLEQYVPEDTDISKLVRDRCFPCGAGCQLIVSSHP